MVTAVGTDDDGTTDEDSDDETVTFEDVQPDATLVKTVVSAVVTYRVTVTNDALEDVTLTQLVDTINGVERDITTECGLPEGGVTLASGQTYTCDFVTEPVVPGETTDLVTGTVSDNDGNTINPSDDAWVRFENAPPTP